MTVRSLACSILLMLTGCAASGSAPVKPSLPVLPADLAAPCGDPGVRAGASALTELARNRLALAECAHRHRDAVIFYDGVREGMAQ